MKVKIDGIRLRGIASALPRHTVHVGEIMENMSGDELARMIKTTGVEEIRTATDGMTASDLCFAAAKHLMEKLSVKPDDIDALIFLSISPDYITPATAILLQDRLGLRKDIVAYDIPFGCSAYSYGLYNAAMLVKAGGAKRVLVCTGDTHSTYVNERDRSLRVLIGDAGAATIVEAGDETLCFDLSCDGSGYDQLIIPAGGRRIPCSEETRKAVKDEKGNYHSQENTYMDGIGIMNFALNSVPAAVNSVLGQAGWSKDDVAMYAMHQPNKLVLDFLVRRLRVKGTQMPVTLQHTGNAGAASIPLLFGVEKKRGFDFSRADKVVACGFGIGLSTSAAAMDLSKTEIFEPIEI